MFIEVVTALTLLAMITALSAEGLFRYRRSRNDMLKKQMLILAASSQLDRIAAGAPLDLPPPDGILPQGVSIVAVGETGQGDWQGLRRVTVTASVTAGDGREIREQISRYFAAEAKP